MARLKSLALFQAVKSSAQSKFFAGTIRLSQSPTLSIAALNVLRDRSLSSQDAEREFNRSFGDYYVASLGIGGSNATMVSAAATQGSSSKFMAADLTFKILGFEKTKHFEDAENARSFDGSLSLSSFDSLDSQMDDLTSTSENTYPRLKSLADANMLRAKTMEARSRQKLKDLNVGDRCYVSWNVCEAICKQGLVVELLLLPFSGLRDYAQIIRSRAMYT